MVRQKCLLYMLLDTVMLQLLGCDMNAAKDAQHATATYA